MILRNLWIRSIGAAPMIGASLRLEGSGFSGKILVEYGVKVLNSMLIADFNRTGGLRVSE